MPYRDKDKHNAYHRERIHQRRNILREYVKAVKAGLGCSRCEENHPACLDFHHTRDKEFAISKAIRQPVSLDKLKAEIAKCILLCANCHRKEHWAE